MKIRSIVVGVALSLAPLLGTAVTSIAAGGEVAVSVPASTHVMQFTHKCADRALAHVKMCTATLTVHMDSHVEYRIPGTSNGALACYGTSYKTGYVYWNEYGGFGNLLWSAREDVEDWFNGCSAGNVYISPSCHANGPWSCKWPPPTGAFWDPGKGANTDWDNQETDAVYTQYVTYLRFWTYPDGHSTWWSQSQCLSVC